MAVHKINPRLAPKPAPVRTIEVALDGDYAGWVATMRTNHKYGTLMDLSGGDQATQLAAMAAIFIAWNWVDEDGNELPQPPEGLREADSEAVAAAMQKWADAQQKAAELPKA